MATTIATGYTNAPKKQGEPPDHGFLYTGKGLEFDGATDYIVVADTTALNPQDGDTGFTWTCWFKSSSAANPSATEYLMDKYYATDRIRISFTTSGYLNFSIEEQGGGTYNVSLSTDEDWYDAQWHHFAGTFEVGGATGHKIWIDGVNVKTGGTAVPSNVFSSWSNARDFYISRDSATDQMYFAGSISNVQIWNAAWSESDVQYAYTHPEKLASNNPGTSLAESNLKLWYPMNEGNPRSPQTTVYDATPVELGSEMIVDGDFALTGTQAVSTTGTYWTTGSDWTIANGKATYSDTVGGYNSLIQAEAKMTTPFENGKRYKITLDISDITSGDTYFQILDEDANAFDILGLTAQEIGNGSYTYYVEGNADTDAGFSIKVHSNSDVFSISNISVKPMTVKNHGTTVFYGDELITTTNDRDFENNAGGTDQSGWIKYGEAVTNIDGGTDELQINYSDTSNSLGAEYTLPASLITGRTYRFALDIQKTDGDANTMVLYLNTAASTSITITASKVNYYRDIVATADSTNIKVVRKTDEGAVSASDDEVTIDNVSVKEIGVAKGWTEADQQLDIPQTALMGGSRKMRFDGIDDKITVGDLSANANTVSVWFKPDSAIDKDTADQNLLNIGDADYEGIMFGAWTGVITNEIISIGSASARTGYADASASISASWHHFAMSWDSDNSKYLFYLDGAALSTTSGSGSHVGLIDADEFIIGTTTDNAKFFSGIIDDVSVFTTSLSLAEVQELYNDGIPLDATAHTQASNLVGYWRNNVLHTDGKWKDLTESDGSGNNGTVIGGTDVFFQSGLQPGRDSQGFFETNPQEGGGVLSFDGVGDYVDIGRTMTIVGEFSVECWFKTDDLSANYILGVSSHDILRIEGLDEVIIKVNNQGDDSFDVDDPVALLINTWYHLVITRNSSDLATMYIDGTAQVDTQEVTGDFDFRYIGFDGDANYFKGELDELKVYDRKLIPAEITKNYNGSKGKHKN